MKTRSPSGAAVVLAALLVVVSAGCRDRPPPDVSHPDDAEPAAPAVAKPIENQKDLATKVLEANHLIEVVDQLAQDLARRGAQELMVSPVPESPQSVVTSHRGIRQLLTARLKSRGIAVVDSGSLRLDARYEFQSDELMLVVPITVRQGEQIVLNYELRVFGIHDLVACFGVTGSFAIDHPLTRRADLLAAMKPQALQAQGTRMTARRESPWAIGIRNNDQDCEFVNDEGLALVAVSSGKFGLTLVNSSDEEVVVRVSLDGVAPAALPNGNDLLVPAKSSRQVSLGEIQAGSTPLLHTITAGFSRTSRTDTLEHDIVPPFRAGEAIVLPVAGENGTTTVKVIGHLREAISVRLITDP